MMTHPLPIAGKLPIKTLVARQLPTNMYACMHVLFTIAYMCMALYVLFIRTPFRASNFIGRQLSTNIILYYTVFSPGEIFGLPPTLMGEKKFLSREFSPHNYVNDYRALYT